MAQIPDQSQVKLYEQPLSRQPDGPGKRIKNISELTLCAPVKPGGAEQFRKNVAKYQAESGYYEFTLGTVHDLRIVFFNNDTQVLFAATYEGDFKPYVEGVLRVASTWLDEMFVDVLEGFAGGTGPDTVEFILKHIVEAEVWFVSNPDETNADMVKRQKIVHAFDALLDAAQS